MNVLAGRQHPTERGATRIVRTVIRVVDDTPSPICIWDNGDETLSHWMLDADTDGAWLDFALDETTPRHHRAFAIQALIAEAHESHRYDCAD